ncbi:MAG: DUF1295 domain-containing protein [Pseudomonadota bacterium]
MNQSTPAPAWARACFRGINYMIEDVGGGPRPLALGDTINSHKFITFFVILGMMVYTGNFSTPAWIYLCLHGVYGWCWLVKDFSARDAQFNKPVTIGAACSLYGLYGIWIWGLPWLFLTRQVAPSNTLLAACITMHTLGVVIMVAADLQKTFTLRLKKGLISDGLFAYTRNPNFLGEIMIYASYVLLADHPYAYAFAFFQWVFLFTPRMLVKDASLSRHPGWADYKARSGLLLPLRWRR